MTEYKNHNVYSVYLTDQNGKVIILKPGQKIILDEYFDTYVNRGFIQRTGTINQPVVLRQRDLKPSMHNIENKMHDKVYEHKPAVHSVNKPVVYSKHINSRQRTVGRPTCEDASQVLVDILRQKSFPISNNIGVGILSYNRLDCLKNLVESIRRYTDLNRTTVFISDDCSNDSRLLDYLDDLKNEGKFVVLRNSIRLGVAGNSNRLLRCLNRFEDILLLNDDVEVLQRGWDSFYSSMLNSSGLLHACHHQLGVYGAKHGPTSSINGVSVRIINDKPHGAILAAKSSYIDHVGYMDHAYGYYGMEHVDWSSRAWGLGLQPNGFIDFVNSESYFKTNSVQSSVEDKSRLLEQARDYHAKWQPRNVQANPDSAVPMLSCIIPCRNMGSHAYERSNAISTIINNIRGQKFPAIQILVVEDDSRSMIERESVSRCGHILTHHSSVLFNKSMAFNVGVYNAVSDYLVLHDADTMATGDYFQEMYDVLQDNDSAHLCRRVIYADKESSDLINSTSKLSDVRCNRSVGYFEGGSLGCRSSVYWNVGGFNEDFKGYGNEDTDFYYRLSRGSAFLERRSFDLLHLWHGRTDGWEIAHEANKALEAQLRLQSFDSYINMQRNRILMSYPKRNR